MEVARHVCDLHGLPVEEETFSDLGRHIRALNNKGTSSQGESAIPMIGSTSLSHAVVLNLSWTIEFSASLLSDHNPISPSIEEALSKHKNN